MEELTHAYQGKTGQVYAHESGAREDDRGCMVAHIGEKYNLSESSILFMLHDFSGFF
jgi:hypothetical protein